MDRGAAVLPLTPLSQPPSQCTHIPQPHACVLQTAVKQSRLECVTACNTALGHARCLLPLRTECEEIINRFEFSAEQRGSRRLCLRERKRKLCSRIFWMGVLFSFHPQIIKYPLTDFPLGFG